MHLANGAIKDHMLQKHNSNIGREHLVNQTEILRKQNDTFRMLIHEALHIKFHNPNLNRQDTGSKVHISTGIYTYQSCWNVFLRGKSWKRRQPIDLLQFSSLLICNVA